MAFPPGMWTMTIRGLYLRPDGSPQRGHLTFTPGPASVGQQLASSGAGTLVLQSVRVPIGSGGRISVKLLNPNDPTLSPGPLTGAPWAYCVQEFFRQGPVLGWVMQVPADAADGAEIDLGHIERLEEQVVRPADWFPSHFAGRPLSAGSSGSGHAL